MVRFPLDTPQSNQGQNQGQQQVRELIPADLKVLALCEEIKPRTIYWKDKEDGSQKSAELLDWTFRIVDPSSIFENRKIRGSSDAKPRPGGGYFRTRAWGEALLGRDLDGAEYDTEDFIGRTAYIITFHEIDKKDSEKKYAKVRDVHPSS